MKATSMIRRGTLCRTSSPQRSASSTRAYMGSPGGGSSGGSGAISSSLRMIVRDPAMRSPSIRTPGTRVPP